jgi:hypothetical protein
MSGALRALTVLNALVYFGASAYHSGLLEPAGALAPASIAEALLGLVLVAALIGPVAPRIAYVVVFAGTIFGLSIVIARGLLGVDLWIHVVMLAGLAAGFVLLFARRPA